jgi:hypothetical protein
VLLRCQRNARGRAPGTLRDDKAVSLLLRGDAHQHDAVIPIALPAGTWPPPPTNLQWVVKTGARTSRPAACPMSMGMTAPITSGKLPDLSEALLATWKLQNDGAKVTLVYFQRGQAMPQHCGSGDARLFPDVLAWCAQSAAVADIILVEDRAFARLPPPCAVHGCLLPA